MQLSTLLEGRGVWLDLQWLQRDSNTEADALSNADFAGFDLARRIPVSWPLPDFHLLRDMLAAGVALYAELDLLKAQGPRARQRRAPREKRLKVTDPW